MGPLHIFRSFQLYLTKIHGIDQIYTVFDMSPMTLKSASDSKNMKIKKLWVYNLQNWSFGGLLTELVDHTGSNPQKRLIN